MGDKLWGHVPRVRVPERRPRGEGKGADMKTGLLGLLKKAKVVVLVMLAVYVVSFGAGFAAGKLKLANAVALRNSSFFQFNRNLEYKVPGYGDLLRRYKERHNVALMQALNRKDRAALARIFFVNNFYVANLTMAVRAVLIVPLVFYPGGRFLQGATMAQTPGSSRTLYLLLMEFGGYFLVICGALCLSLWTIFPRRFAFTSRGAAFLGGLKILVLAWLVSGIFIAWASVIEVRLLLGG